MRAPIGKTPRPATAHAKNKQNEPTPTPTNLSSCERGRRYRHRLQHYQYQLQHDVERLHKHVRDLKLLAQLQQQLANGPTPTTVAAVLSRVHDVLNHTDCIVEPTPRTDALRFYVETFRVVSAGDAPVVQLRGSLRGRLAHRTIHVLYGCVPGNSALLNGLLDRDVTFATTQTLYFGVDGALVRTVHETDYVSALAMFTQDARGWSEMLGEMQR